MIQNYITNLKSEETTTQETFWDAYLDRQLTHLVLEYSFDFERISSTLKNMKYKNSENVIDRQKCQSRWAFLHLSRKQNPQNPAIKIEETLEEKFNKLMSRQAPLIENDSTFENTVDESNKPSGKKNSFI